MVQCAAFNCTKKSGTGEKISMFSFPDDRKAWAVWLFKLRRDGFTPTKHTRLCADHFEPGCFVTDPRLMNNIGFMPKMLRLKSGAIPTIFDYSPRTPKTPVPNVYRTPNRKRSGTSGAVNKRRRIEILTEHQQENNDPEISVAANISPVFKVEQSHKATQTVREMKDSCVGPDTPMDSRTFSIGCQTTYGLVKRRHVDVQVTSTPLPESTTPKLESCGVVSNIQCHQATTATLAGSTTSTYTITTAEDDDQEEELQTEQECHDIDPTDPDWTPTDHMESLSDDEETEGTAVMFDNDDVDAHKAIKYIVFEENLLQLLDVCHTCGQTNLRHEKVNTGTCLTVFTSCKCGFQRRWSSQPFHKSMPWGNMIVAGAIFFSGNSPVRTVNLFRNAGINGLSLTSYNKLQRFYLVPSTLSIWQSKQNLYLANVKRSGTGMKLGGDARCCSPGHTAKYGSYTLMDVQTNKVVDIQLVQSNEVKNSYAMEMEGLKRGLKLLDEEGVKVTDLVTDRHSQVKKYMRDQHPEINHWFDVWHVAKGVYKKLEAVGRKKQLAIVGQWARSISNHVYWCAASSGGNGELVKQKWNSIMQHIADIHEGHGDLFPKCLHGDLNSAWIKPGSKAYKEIERIVCGKLIAKDIQKLSPAGQTSSLESFHNTICAFAPKSTHYFYDQMNARLCLAALHFNANSSRDQAIGKDGKGCYKISFPKARKGDAVPKEVKVQQNYDYINELMQEIIVHRELFDSYKKAKEARERDMASPPPSIASGHRQAICNFDRESIIDNQSRRFNPVGLS